jgi:hypothetical protein
VRLAPSTKEKLDFFLRHPLTLSLTGMLLGSLLIPWIVGRSSKQAAVADTRLKQALQVMATSNGVDATINKIETAFEGFEKDSLSIEQQTSFFDVDEPVNQTLYKYVGVGGLDILEAPRLKINSAVGFNDPFEFAPLFKKPTVSVVQQTNKMNLPPGVLERFSNLFVSNWGEEEIRWLRATHWNLLTRISGLSVCQTKMMIC